MEASFVVHPNEMLVPVHTYDRLPTYFIFAGLGASASWAAEDWGSLLTLLLTLLI